MDRDSFTEQTVTALIAAASESEIAGEMRQRIDDVVSFLDEREDVVSPALRLAVEHALSSPAPAMDAEQIRWGVRAYVNGVIRGLAVAIAAHEPGRRR